MDVIFMSFENFCGFLLFLWIAILVACWIGWGITKIERNTMTKLKVILLIILICIFISSCAPEVSRTYPVKDYIVLEDGVIASFDVKGKEHVHKFEEWLVYPTEGENIVVALYWEHLADMPEDANEIYLYLNEE